MRRELEGGIEQAVDTITGLAHEYLTDDVGRAHDLFLADDRDREGISKPTAAMMARQLRAAGMSGDVAEGIALAFAVGSYLFKQGTRALAARRYRRELAAGYGTVDGFQPADQAEQPYEPPPAPAAGPDQGLASDPPPVDRPVHQTTDTPFGQGPLGSPIRGIS